ncbi:MAG: SDR family NAD(P)-dependent oxidoreductase, partial [Rhodospirillaceae bacterium]|nr:SDR family NAD(P)-dependent oxidoreductase [Rhodospirillaceae bacterium]
MPDYFSGRVAGKVALITGAGSGLGRASAIHLAEEGATIIASDLNEETAAETVATMATM